MSDIQNNDVHVQTDVHANNEPLIPASDVSTPGVDVDDSNEISSAIFFKTKVIDDVSDDSVEDDVCDDQVVRWVETEEGVIELRSAVDRINRMNQFGAILQKHLASKGSKSFGIFENFNEYISFSMLNDDYIKHLSQQDTKEVNNFIDLMRGKTTDKLKEVVKVFKSASPVDISRWSISSLISDVPKQVQDEFGFNDNIITVADLISLSIGSRSNNAYKLSIALGMQNTFNMFGGGRLFSTGTVVNGESNIFFTHLFHKIEGVDYRVAIILNSNSPAVPHFIKLFITFMLKFKPDLFSSCNKGLRSSDDSGFSGSVVYIGIDLLVGYFFKALSAFKSLLKSSKLRMSDFKVSKGNFCHFLASFYIEKVIYVSDKIDSLHGKYGLLVADGTTIVGMSVPCLHCFHPHDTNSEFMFNPNVFDPVVLSTDHMYSDGNNPPVWFLDHKLGSRDESNWLRSLLFSSNYSRAYFELNVANVAQEMSDLYPEGVHDNIVGLNLLYPTHHYDSLSTRDEHAHIRLSLFYSLDVTMIKTNTVESLLIPGHIMYFIDSVVGYIKDGFLASKKSDFKSIRDIMIKRIKTNFSYLCLPESGSALLCCYKLYILLFWIQVLPGISDFLCFLANSLHKQRIIIPKKIASQDEVKVYNNFIKTLDEAKVKNTLHSLIKNIIYNYLCLDITVVYILPENIKAIFNAKDECCNCNLCDSLGLGLSDASINVIDDVIVFKIISYLNDSNFDRLAMFKSAVCQAESISKILQVNLNNLTVNSNLVGDISLCLLSINDDSDSLKLVGFKTSDKKVNSALNIKRGCFVTTESVKLILDDFNVDNVIKKEEPKVEAFSKQSNSNKKDDSEVQFYNNNSDRNNGRNRYGGRNGSYNGRSWNQNRNNRYQKNNNNYRRSNNNTSYNKYNNEDNDRNDYNEYHNSNRFTDSKDLDNKVDSHVNVPFNDNNSRNYNHNGNNRERNDNRNSNQNNRNSNQNNRNWDRNTSRNSQGKNYNNDNSRRGKDSNFNRGGGPVKLNSSSNRGNDTLSSLQTYMTPSSSANIIYKNSIN